MIEELLITHSVAKEIIEGRDTVTHGYSTLKHTHRHTHTHTHTERERDT